MTNAPDDDQCPLDRSCRLWGMFGQERRYNRVSPEDKAICDTMPAPAVGATIGVDVVDLVTGQDLPSFRSDHIVKPTGWVVDSRHTRSVSNATEARWTSEMDHSLTASAKGVFYWRLDQSV
jgi:hypothetical protein